MNDAVFDDDTLVRAAGAFVLTLRDTGKYTKPQIKKAFSARMVDAYFALGEKRDREIAEHRARPLVTCAANRDGECHHAQCPQLRDEEPESSGRHCPLDTATNED